MQMVQIISMKWKKKLLSLNVLLLPDPYLGQDARLDT